MFPSWVMVCKLSKKWIFYNFVLTSARNLSLLNQFTYMHIEALSTLFQKMLSFKGVWATAHEILAIIISKKMLTQQEFKKNSSTSNTNISKTVSHDIISNTIFWKCVTRPWPKWPNDQMTNDPVVFIYFFQSNYL